MACRARPQTGPRRAVFYYQPQAAHWWFWPGFDRALYSQELARFREAHIDTVTFDVQVKDFVKAEAGTALRMDEDNLEKLRWAVREADRQGLGVLLILWYTNGVGLDQTWYAGGARLVEEADFARYLEMTRRVAAATRGARATFFFTNELFQFYAVHDAKAGAWRLNPYPPASVSFARWARASNGDLAHWNGVWGTSFASWDDVRVDPVFPRPSYWDWLAWLIRGRLPALAHAIRQENPKALVGYEDYTYVYGWGDSAIPWPCPLDLIGFGVYRDMFTNSPARAEEAYLKLTTKFPGVRVFVAEVGMDTHAHGEQEQAEWYRSIVEWANGRGLGTNMLMWRDYTVKREIMASMEQARFGLLREDGTPKPVFQVLRERPPRVR